ncbi:hypothetical protein EON65_19845 [archaeon]|nr:MAG: hypothetical protein EON65_19845 [archaeon]
MMTNLVEISIDLHDKALGINLRPILGNRGAYVDSFYQDRPPSLQVGDILHIVGTIDVSEERIEDIQRILKRSKRPIHLTFRRHTSIVVNAPIIDGDQSTPDTSVKAGQSPSISLTELVESPFYDVWVRKFLKSTRVYFGDKEDYKLFVKLQEMHMVLTNMQKLTSEDSMSSMYLHQLLLYIYKQLTDVYQQNDMVFPIPSSDHICLQGLVTCVHEYLSILYLRGVNTIFDQFHSAAYMYMQHMHAYYYRSLYKHQFILHEVTSILVHPSDHLYLYLFLYKYPVLTKLMHKYCAAPTEETCVEVLVTMLQHNLVLRFYASEYYQLYLEELQCRQRQLDGDFNQASTSTVMWTQYLPRTCSLVYPTNNLQPTSVYDLAYLNRCMGNGSIRRYEWHLRLADSTRGSLAIKDHTLGDSELVKQQLHELLVEHFSFIGENTATYMLLALQLSRSCQTMCIVEVYRVDIDQNQHACALHQPTMQLVTPTPSTQHINNVQTIDSKRPFTSTSEVLSAVQPSIGYLASLTTQANRSLLATFKKQLPTFSSWMKVKPDLEGMTTNSSPENSQSSSSSVNSSDSIELMDASFVSKLPAKVESNVNTTSVQISGGLFGNLYVPQSSEEYEAHEHDTASDDVPVALLSYTATLTQECILDFLRPHQLCLLLNAFLLERKIVILIPHVKYSELPLVFANFLCSLCKPLGWQHVYAPLLSSSTAKQLLGCPAPYILGCTINVYEDYLKEQKVSRVEDSVIVVFNSDGLLVDIDSKDKALIEMKSDWLFNQLQAIMQPAFCRYSSIKKISNGELQRRSMTLSYPVDILTIPARVELQCQSKLECLVSLCNYFVTCLLHGSQFCCYTGCVQASSGSNRPEGLKSRRRSIASANESYNNGLNDTRESMDEIVLGEASSDIREGGERDVILDSYTADPGSAEQEEADTVDDLDDGHMVERSAPIQSCLVFDERMFLDIKKQQQELGHDLGFDEDFLKTFLRSQCLAVYLASCCAR